MRIQGGMVCVLGERWCVLMTITVMMMEAMTKTMVKSMYFPISGTALEVDGISSTITSRKTVRDSRTEMDRVIFSPAEVDREQTFFISGNHLRFSENTRVCVHTDLSLWAGRRPVQSEKRTTCRE